MVQAQQIPRSSGHYCFGTLAMCFCSLQQRVGEIESGVLIGCRGDELIEGAVLTNW
jgi:hypothetical protein